MNRFLIGLVVFFYACVAFGQDVYVTDKLQLQLRESQENSSKILSRLNSGDKLTLIERGDSQSKVTTEDGTTGWVKSWFLVDTPPAIVQLKTAEVELEKLKKQLDSANQLEDVNANNNSHSKPQMALKERIAQLESLIDQRDETIKLIQNESNRLKFKKSKQKGFDINLLLYIAAGITVIAFLAGYFTYSIKISRRQKKRLNGYRMSI